MGPKGGTRRKVNAEKGVVGMEYRVGEWAGEKCLADLMPIYEPDKKGKLPREVAEGRLCGGWALEVYLGKYIDGVQAHLRQVKERWFARPERLL